MDLYKQKSTWWLCVCYHFEQLNAILKAVDVKAYAWILHDKDINPDTEVLKKPHYHCLIQFHANNRGSWFKRFDSDDMGRVMIEPCISPEGSYAYLTHEDPKSIKAGKYRYDKTELTSIIESFVNDDLKINKHVTLYNSILAVLNKEMTWHDFYKAFPEYILSARNIDYFANEVLNVERIKMGVYNK